MMKIQLIATCFVLIVCAIIAINGQQMERRSPIMKRAALLRLGKRLYETDGNAEGQFRLLHKPSNGIPFRYQNVRFRNENGDLFDDDANSKEEVKQAWRDFLDKLYSESNESGQEKTIVY
jgi:hypothetical protein